MVSARPGNPTVKSAPFSTLVVVCVLASCILGAQSCMPMMNMMMPMMEQAQNAMVFQASNSMFKTVFENFGQPLFKLHVGGATSLVYHVLMLMSPFPFAPESWFQSAVQVGNLIVSSSYFLVSVVESLIRTIITLAQTNWFDKLGGLLRMIYSVRLNLSPLVATTSSPLALEADQQVAQLVRDLNIGEEEAREGRSREGAAQDCVRELVCGLWASRATTHLWQAFWTMIPLDEEPPSLPQFCGEENEEFSSCYVFVDDVVQTWQAQLDYYLNQYNNISSKGFSYQNKSIIWAVYG